MLAVSPRPRRRSRSRSAVSRPPSPAPYAADRSPHRDISGCLICRLRKKRCSFPGDENGATSCAECVKFHIACFGAGLPRPVMDRDMVLNTISLWIKEKKWKLDPQTPLLQLPDVWQSLRPSIAHFAGQLFNSPSLLSVPTPSHAMAPMEVEQDADSRQDPESESPIPISPAKDAFIDNWDPLVPFLGDHNSSQCPAIRVHSSEDSSTHRMSDDDLQRSIEIIHHPDKLVQESHQRLTAPRNDFNNGPSGLYPIFPMSTSWGPSVNPEIQISNLEAYDGFEMVASPVDDARCALNPDMERLLVPQFGDQQSPDSLCAAALDSFRSSPASPSSIDGSSIPSSPCSPFSPFMSSSMSSSFLDVGPFTDSKLPMVVGSLLMGQDDEMLQATSPKLGLFPLSFSSERRTIWSTSSE